MVCLFGWAGKPILGIYGRWHYELNGNGIGTENHNELSSDPNINNDNFTAIATTTIASDSTFCQYIPFMLALIMLAFYGLAGASGICAFILRYRRIGYTSTQAACSSMA